MEAPSYCSKRMLRRSPWLMRTMQSLSWKRPSCSALPPLSRRLTNKPRVLKGSKRRVSELHFPSAPAQPSAPATFTLNPFSASLSSENPPIDLDKHRRFVSGAFTASGSILISASTCEGGECTHAGVPAGIHPTRWCCSRLEVLTRSPAAAPPGWCEGRKPLQHLPARLRGTSRIHSSCFTPVKDF